MARLDPFIMPAVEGWINILDAAGPARDISLLRPDRHCFSSKSCEVVTWHPYYCLLNPTANRLICLHSADQASSVIPSITSDGVVPVKIGGTRCEFVSQRQDRGLHQWHKASPEMFSRRRGLSEKKCNRSREGVCEKALVSGARRGSAPLVVSCVSSTADSTDSISSGSSSVTPSRFMNYISRKSTQFKDSLKRTRSATKLDRRTPDVVVVGNGPATLDDSVFTPVSKSQPTSTMGTTSATSLKRVMSLGRLSRRWNKSRTAAAGCETDTDNKAAVIPRASSKRRVVAAHSHESLLMSNKPTSSSSADVAELIQRTVDLSGSVEIHPLHGSVLGQQHCFQVSTRSGSTYFACRSEDERREWMHHFRRIAQPQHEQQQRRLRTEHQLKLWILEAKNIPPKYRYFCEVCLDKTLYARTTSRLNVDMLFWGEHFDLFNLPPVEKITINLYREADKRRKKDSHMFVGSIDIATSEVSGRQMTDRWFTLTAPSAAVRKDGRGAPGSTAVIRVKVNYRSIKVLPVRCYKPLIEFIQSGGCTSVIRALEPVLTVRAKDELATVLVSVLQSIDAARNFLVETVMDEVKNEDNHKTLFRGNSVATKAVEAYMKLVGEKYLNDTLGEYVQMVMDSADNFEVDPSVLGSSCSSSDLQRRRGRLTESCRLIWYKIVNSQAQLPLELRHVFMSLRERYRQHRSDADTDVGRQLISSCIFLRFLCPAILSPSLFGLSQMLPQQRVSRNLTLVAKTIQGLANFTRFEGKEGYMTFMNSFVEEHTPEMRKFLDQLSMLDGCHDPPTFSGHIDYGKEASQLHSILVDLLDKVDNKKSVDAVDKLRQILADISMAATHAGSQDADSTGTVESRSCEYDNVTSLSTSSSQLDVPDVSADSEVSANGRFVSNTSVMLSPAVLSPAVMRAPPRTRTAMHEMRDSNGYVSVTNNLPVCPPATSVRHRQPAPVADVEKEWQQIVHVAETVIESTSSVDEIGHTSLEHLPVSADSADTDRQRMVVFTVGDARSNGLQSPQPLSFANPLFGYKTSSSRPSAVGSATSLDSSVIQKSYSLTSVADSNDTRSPSTVAGRTTTVANHGDSPGRSVLSQQKICTGLKGRKPSQSNECLTDGGGVLVREHSQARHSAILPSCGSSPKLLGRGSNLSQSTELAVNCNADQSKHSSTASSIVGLDTPPDSPRYVGACQKLPGSRKVTPSQNCVRMGVRSMQRRPVEPEKSKIEYEVELHTVRQQLSATQSALDDMTSQLSRERSLSCQQHGDWQQRLHAAEERHRQREAELTLEIGRGRHREAELSAELGRMKQREADVTFELTQQRNRVSELSIELAQTERREADTKEELQRLTHMLADHQTNAASHPSNAVEHMTSKYHPVFQRFESVPSMQSPPFAGVPPRTRLRSDTSLARPADSSWTQPF